jgi:hypothetical protein
MCVIKREEDKSYAAFVKQHFTRSTYRRRCYDSLSVYSVHFAILIYAVASHSLFRRCPTRVAALFLPLIASVG